MNKPALRIGFAGTPDFAAWHLEALLGAGHNIVAVYTQPDRPAGRGKLPQPSPVKVLAQASNLPISQPASLITEEAQLELQSLNLDVLVVVAYGLLLPQSILEIPRFGCINVHASLLPKWRGAAPIERAILAGDEQTGVTIMQMDAGLDTGPIILSKTTAISNEDNTASLTQRLALLGKEALLEALDQIESNGLVPLPQDDSLSSYANKISKEDALISWDKSALEIQHQVNAMYPRSPAYSFYKGQRLRIIQVQIIPDVKALKAGTIDQVSKEGIKVCCKNSCLLIKIIQLPGKAENSIQEFLNGHKDFFSTGTMFSSASSQK